MLTVNDSAPDISARSINGDLIDLKNYQGRKVLIKFHRFSGCAIARRQIHDWIAQEPRWKSAGMEVIIFLHNSRDKVVPVLQEVPGLHIIPDRKKEYYRKFGSAFGLSKLFSPGTWMAVLKALSGGFMPLFNRFQGGVIGIPSDFLIDGKGRIIDLHYGSHFGDSWTVDDVLKRI